MNKDVFEKVKNFIVEELSVDPSIVTLEASLQNDLGADSLDAVQIIMDCEDTFGLTISNEDAKDFLTVKDVVEYVEKHM